MEKSSGALVFCLNLLTEITSGDKESDVALHPIPTKGVLQILVHFGSAWVNRVGGILCFLHNQIL
jgi:hypothetical protein